MSLRTMWIWNIVSSTGCFISLCPTPPSISSLLKHWELSQTFGTSLKYKVTRFLTYIGTYTFFSEKRGFRLSEEEIPKRGMERKGLEKKTNGDEGLNLNSPLQPMKRNGLKCETALGRA